MSLASWFQQVAYVASVTSKSGYGDPTYGVKRKVRCRVEAVSKALRRTTGEEAVASHLLYTDAVVALTDRVWLPGVSTASDDGARTPISITAAADKTGSRTLYEVHL